MLVDNVRAFLQRWWTAPTHHEQLVVEGKETNDILLIVNRK